MNSLLLRKVVIFLIIVSTIISCLVFSSCATKCDTCGGSGKVTCASCNDGVCKYCKNGVETMANGSTLLCIKCKGTTICGACDGKLKFDCPRCEGKGRK